MQDINYKTDLQEKEYDDENAAAHYGWDGGKDDAHMQRVLWDNLTASANADDRPASAYDRREHKMTADADLDDAPGGSLVVPDGLCASEPQERQAHMQGRGEGGEARELRFR
jgi:hypothetical protein